MKTTYWLLFAAMIAPWILLPVDLLAFYANWRWWNPVQALLILAMYAEAFFGLVKQDKHFLISGGLVLASKLLMLFVDDKQAYLVVLGLVIHLAGIISFCFFLKNISPDGAKNRADTTAWGYILSVVLILCGMLFQVGWFALIGLLVLLVCEILLMRTIFRCARCYRNEWFVWKPAYTTTLIAIAAVGIGLHFFINYTSIGNFLSETRVFPTQIRWSESKKKYDTQLYVYEEDGVYIPYSAFQSSDRTWNGRAGTSAYGMESSRQLVNGTIVSFFGGRAHFGNCYLATINDLPWPLVEDYACFDVPGERDTTVEGWRLDDGWAVLLLRTDNDTAPEDMHYFSEIYAYQMRHFYEQAGLTPPLLFSSYTWADIFTEVKGETVFAGLPRDMTPEDMPEYYGISYKEYTEDKNAYLQAKQEGHQYYSGNLILQLDGAAARCFLHFEDDVFENMTIEISAEDNQFSDEEFKAYKEKLISGLKSQFPDYRTGTIGNQFGDISILQSFYDGLIRIDMRYLR